VKASPAWRERDELLQSVLGSARRCRRTLLAELAGAGHRLRATTVRAVRAGPFNRDSGRRRGPRSIYGGRSHVRAALYQAALVAMRLECPLQGV